MALEVVDVAATVTSPKESRSGNKNNAVSNTVDAGINNQTSHRRANKGIEPIFHPQLRRTKEVIRRPEWVRRAGEAVAHRGSLNSMALFGILFANCVGGGYGFEDGIGSAGPLITTIVCVLLPWIWAFPTGLAVAELSTAIPSNSGVLMWTNAAFPPFMSFLCIMATLFITFIGNAIYPNLTAEYVENVITLSKGGVAGVKIGVLVVCCVLNCVGVEIVGNSSIILCAITIAPFLLLTVIQLFGHGFNKAVLYVNVKQVNWADFFSIISWNYANIENAGAVVEEIANPRRALPSAMTLLMISTYVAYVLPMLAGVSAMGVGQDYSQWKAGHWPLVAEVIAGAWLKYVLFCGAILSGLGFTLTSMCCTSRLLAGMGTMHMFPKKISRFIGYYHPKLGTPIPAIICNCVVTMVFCISLDFTSVVALCQSLYCMRMLLIYAALIKLRVQYPRLARPYALPCNTWVTALLLVPAALFSLFSAVISAMTSLGIGIAFGCFVVVGCGVSWLYCRIFARNGFQGVIVQCDMSETDDDEVSATSEPQENLNEGVFYHDDEDGEVSSGGDLLLGILPLSAEANNINNNNNNNSSTIFNINRSVAFNPGFSNIDNSSRVNDNFGHLNRRINSERYESYEENYNINNKNSNNNNNNSNNNNNNDYDNNDDNNIDACLGMMRSINSPQKDSLRTNNIDNDSNNSNNKFFTSSPMTRKTHLVDVEMTSYDGYKYKKNKRGNNDGDNECYNENEDNNKEEENISQVIVNNVHELEDLTEHSNTRSEKKNNNKKDNIANSNNSGNSDGSNNNSNARKRDNAFITPVKSGKNLRDITNKVTLQKLTEKNADLHVARKDDRNDNDIKKADEPELIVYSDAEDVNYSPQNVNNLNANDLYESNHHLNSPHKSHSHYHDANARVICNSLENTPSSHLSVTENELVMTRDPPAGE